MSNEYVCGMKLLKGNMQIWFTRLAQIADKLNKIPSIQPRSLSDLGSRSEKMAGRGQILPIFCVNSWPIDQKIGEICTAQAFLQPILPKSDRLLS